jgi:Ca2+:H+ antiporter
VICRIADQFPVYVAYLAFQLYSHTGLYEDKGDHNAKTTAYDKPKFTLSRVRRRFGDKDLEKSKPTEQAGFAMTDAPQTLSPGGPPPVEEPQITEVEEEEEQPQMSLMMSLGLLVAVTAVGSSFRIFPIAFLSAIYLGVAGGCNSRISSRFD